MKQKSLTIKARNALSGYLFLLPWLIGFFVFTLYPFVFSIFISLNNLTLSPTGIEYDFVGLQWYYEAFRVDTTFSVSLINSLQFVVLSTPMIVISSLIIAIMLNQKFHGKTFFRAIFFFPVIIISGPVINELIQNNATSIIIPGKYMVYQFLKNLPPNLLSDALIFVFDNLVLILWFSGVQILIYLSGLQKIGGSIYEAASIDGAGGWQIFWKIILPFIKPLILINTIYTLAELASFSNNEINTEITKKMTLVGKVYSYSSAMAWIYFLFVLAVIGVAFLLLKDKKVRIK